ncbi:MAG TPA: magnesium/cobalt transporter CorA [Candidatus Polarisedimenticolia bacterium]|nr:magnesium/cobalt transporter CorA [Candidatus Polarisedimenticolia bacterium]
MARTTRRRKPAGMSPGVPVLTGEALAPRMHAILYTAETIEEADPASAGECRELAARPGVLWIDVQGLGDLELLHGLGEIFSLHPLALEDVVSLSQRPKMEDYDSHLYLIARMPELSGGLTDQTSLFVGPRFALTFQERYGDCLGPVRDRLRRGKGQIRRSGPDYLAYAILDAIVDGYFPVLESLGETLEDLEDEVSERPSRSSLARIHGVRRDLLALRRAVWPMRDALASLMREENELVTPATRLYLRDCQDHAVQILDMVETYRELASGLMEIYLSSLSQRMNEVMKVLTIIATIFIPLTFIAGVYGMNFDWMPELRWRWGYPVAMGGMALLALSMLLAFARRGWIGAQDLAPPRRRRTRRPPAGPAARGPS